MILAAFSPLASHLWQSTVFAAVAGLLTLAVRRNQARVRYALWLTASYKFLLPFSWLVSIGHRFEWRAAPVTLSPVFSAVNDAVSGPIFLTSLPAARPESGHQPVLLFAICAIWACGFVAVVAGWTGEWLRIRTIARGGSPLPLRLPIRVVSTRARLEPGIFGIFRPVLLLPEGITGRLTEAQLQAVLTHELCHVRRRDNLAAAVHMLVEALFWFHPLVWWLGARMVEERECACDEEALQTGSQAQAYAESILRVCEFYLESPLTCMSGVTGSDLNKRIQRIMKEHFGVALSARKKCLLATAAVAAVTVPLVVGVLTAPRLLAQDWQTAAGGKMAFDVASVKQNKTDGTNPANRPNANFGLSPSDNLSPTGSPTGGRLSVTRFALNVLIAFAYKLSFGQQNALKSQLPKWALAERFDIEARAPISNPAKDQFRLMMQSLLADRFKLMVHTEVRATPVFALEVAKVGKLGTQLVLHSDDPPCGSVPLPRPVPGLSVADADVQKATAAICGDLVSVPGNKPGLRHDQSRNVNMVQIADYLGLAGSLDRLVIDRTSVNGRYDFSIDFVPEVPRQPGSQPAVDGPSFLDALRDQLGLKLLSMTVPLDELVIDHIEEPSPN